MGSERVTSLLSALVSKAANAAAVWLASNNRDPTTFLPSRLKVQRVTFLWHSSISGSLSDSVLKLDVRLSRNGTARLKHVDWLGKDATGSEYPHAAEEEGRSG